MVAATQLLGRQLEKGHTYSDVGTGKTVTSANLNEHVDNAILLNGAVIDQTLKTPLAADFVLLGDSEVSATGVPRKATVSSLLLANSVQNANLAANAVQATNVADGVLTAAKLATNTLTAANLLTNWLDGVTVITNLPVTAPGTNTFVLLATSTNVSAGVPTASSFRQTTLANLATGLAAQPALTNQSPVKAFGLIYNGSLTNAAGHCTNSFLTGVTNVTRTSTGNYAVNLTPLGLAGTNYALLVSLGTASDGTVLVTSVTTNNFSATNISFGVVKRSDGAAADARMINFQILAQ